MNYFGLFNSAMHSSNRMQIDRQQFGWNTDYSVSSNVKCGQLIYSGV